jgi:hypothetical protein
MEAVLACFKTWSSQHLAFGDFETAKVVSTIVHYLQSLGCSQFPMLDTLKDEVFRSRCSGFRQVNEQGEVDWLILSEVFKSEVCAKLDFKKVIKTLQSLDLLQKPDGKRNSMAMRLPHFGVVRVYRLSSRIFVT